MLLPLSPLPRAPLLRGSSPTAALRRAIQGHGTEERDTGGRGSLGTPPRPPFSPWQPQPTQQPPSDLSKPGSLLRAPRCFGKTDA